MVATRYRFLDEKWQIISPIEYIMTYGACFDYYTFDDVIYRSFILLWRKINKIKWRMWSFGKKWRWLVGIAIFLPGLSIIKKMSGPMLNMHKFLFFRTCETWINIHRTIVVSCEFKALGFDPYLRLCAFICWIIEINYGVRLLHGQKHSRSNSTIN